RRGDFQYATADVRSRESGFEFRKILCRLVSAAMGTEWCGQDRQLARNTFGPRQSCRSHEQATRARIVSRHGAVRTETRSRTITTGAICGNCDGVVCDQRHLFVRTLAAQPG